MPTEDYSRIEMEDGGLAMEIEVVMMTSKFPLSGMEKDNSVIMKPYFSLVMTLWIAKSFMLLEYIVFRYM
jgi:hypothetical protein